MFPPRVSYLHNNKWENLLENKTHKKMFYKVKWSEILSMAKVVGFCPSPFVLFFLQKFFFVLFQKLEKNIYTRRRYIYLFSLKRDILLSEIWLVWILIFIFSLGNFRFVIFHFLFVFIFIFIMKIKYCFENYLDAVYIYYYPRIIINKYNKWWNIKLWFVIVFLKKKKTCYSIKKF